MTNRSQSAHTLTRSRGQDRSRWIVPAAIGILGLITVVLILFAFGVLLGLVHF